MCNRRLLLFVLCGVSATAQSEWPTYGYDPGGTRFSPLKQITPENVRALERAWTYHTGEFGASSGVRAQRHVAFETTPLVIDGRMYFSTPSNRIIALEAQSGRELWKFDLQSNRAGEIKYHPHRGVAYWPGDTMTLARIYFGTMDGKLVALNAKTGERVPGFGNEGEVDLRRDVADKFPALVYGVTSPPAIYRDLIITGSEVPESPGLGPSGDVRAWDILSGKLVWTFHTVPRPGEPGSDTWDGESWRGRTGVNVWTGFTLDVNRGIVYLAIGSPASDFYGADRKGRNLFGDSVVALNAITGARLWSYQLVHHDIWDYDPPAPPALITVKQSGNEIPALVEVTKMGLVFILNRVTGKPLFPVREQAFPPSDVPGEAAWPTQPIPTKPPALSRISMGVEDLTDVTPESRRYCGELLSKLSNKGRYTPYGLHPTLVFPGTLGGATWSGVSYNPDLAFVFVNTNEVGAIGQMVQQPQGVTPAWKRWSSSGEYARFWDPQLLPCQKPPWGLLTAVNVNSGEIAWRVPLGNHEELEARGLRKTGALNIGGSIATASGLVFIGATSDSKFRAFDSRTGQELWSAVIDGSAHATPITYMGRDGKQYVVVAAGGGGFFGSKPADALIAFRLPDGRR